MSKEKIAQWLKGIKKAEVVEEYFPLRKKHSGKKYFRFQVFYKKKYPEFSSGRFRDEEGAQRGLDKFMSGDCNLMFGDVNKKGK